MEAGQDKKRAGIPRRIGREAQPRRDIGHILRPSRRLPVAIPQGEDVLFFAICHGRMVRRTWRRVTVRLVKFVCPRPAVTS
ncbi:MAG: hypothetical protein Q9M33_08220 [Robiginitomaculum sp.]|nr:hypothetical protein [Robiginitomaculum sp.]